MSDVVYLVTERSAVGDTVLGIFTTLEEARQVVSSVTVDGGHLEDYRIEARVLGVAPDPATPWCVVLTRDGRVETAEAAVT